MINIKTLSKFQTKWLKMDYLLVTFLGLVFLTTSHLLLYNGAALSDEVIYAVSARNVYEEQTLNTNIYRLDSIILRGYPTRDHHMPGYVLSLAAIFAIFGVNNGFTIGLPSYLAYLLAGLIFYGIGKSLFKPAIPFWATLLFYIYPISFISASLILVEPSLNLVAVIFVAYWLKVYQAETLGLLDATILAALIVLGLLYRETFIILLPPALFVLGRSYLVRKDYRPLLVFIVVLVTLVLSVFLPLTQDRGYYPRPFSEAVLAGDLTAAFGVVARHLSLTVVPFDAQYLTAILNLVLGIVITVLSLVFIYKSQKALVLLFLYLFWPALVLLTITHAPLFDWATPRHMFTFLWPGLLLFVAAIFEIKRPSIRYASIITVIVVFGLCSILMTRKMMQYQDKTLYQQRLASSMVEKYLKPYDPQTIISYKAFTTAWDHYPMNVVMFFPDSYEEMKILEERLPIDAIVVNNERQRDIILDAGASGLLKHRYISLFPYKVDDHYFLVDEQLQLQTEDK